MTKALALPDIAHVHLDDRPLESKQRIENRHRAVSQSSSVDDDGVGTQACLLNPVHQHTFMVALAKLQLQPQLRSMGLATLLDAGEALAAISAVLVQPIEVGIRAIEEKYAVRHGHSWVRPPAGWQAWPGVVQIRRTIWQWPGTRYASRTRRSGSPDNPGRNQW